MKTRHLGYISAVLAILVSVNTFAFGVTADSSGGPEGSQVGLTVTINASDWEPVWGYGTNCGIAWDYEFIIDITRAGSASWTAPNPDVELVSTGNNLINNNQIVYCSNEYALTEITDDLSVNLLLDNEAGEGTETADLNFSATCSDNVPQKAKRNSPVTLASICTDFVSIDIDDINVLPVVSISAVTDGAEPSTNGSFTISLDQAAPDEGLTVSFDVSGTASPSSDYEALGSSVTFAFGQDSKTIVVDVIDDGEVEGRESVILELQDGDGYVLGQPVRETVWIDDEDVPVVSISAVTDGAEPLMNGSFTISLDQAAPEGGLTVNYNVSGTANPSTDYEALGSSVTFAFGQSSRTIAVMVIDDVELEGQESVILELQPGTGYDLGEPVTETVWIGDDDVTVGFSSVSYTVLEDVGNAKIEITREGATDTETTVTLLTEDGTASDPEDYSKPEKDTQTFAENQTTLTFLVPIVDDAIIEGDETVNLTLVVEDAEEEEITAILTIKNDFAEDIDPDSLPPNQRDIALVILTTCPTGASGEEFQSLCGGIIGEAGQGDSVLDPLIAITPEEQARSPSTKMVKTQGMNVTSRMAALRSGVQGVSVQGFGVNVAGLSMNANMMNSFMHGPAQNQPGYNMANTAGSAANDDTIDFGRWGVFISGRIVWGDKDPTVLGSGYEFDTTGITIGVDYRFTDTFVAGLALGYADQDVDFNQKTGSLDADGFSYTLYGSWYPTDNFFIDGSYTMGNGDFKQERRVDYTLVELGQNIKQTLNADYDGDQRGFNLGAGYDFNRDGWVFGPVFRFEYLDIDIDSYAEQLTDDGGAGFEVGWAAAIDKQDYKSQIASIGFDFSKAISRSWGVIIPQATVSWAKEFKNDNTNITGYFVGDVNKVKFNLLTDSFKENFFRAGLGVSAMFKNNKSAFLMLDGDFGRELLSTYYVNAGFRWEF